jgi:DNA-directed RNA polymerase subunit RPC12/RpoP
MAGLSEMVGDDARCPACGAALARGSDHGVHYQCPQCSGRVMGLSPFEQLLNEGVGAKLWVASEDGPAGQPCPFCHQPMRQPAGIDAPDGLALCHICQQVWIPAEASDWLRSHSAPGASSSAPVAALPERCENCGAPLQVDPAGRCVYCHTQLMAPEPITVNFQTAPASTGSRLLDAVAAFIGRPVVDD